LAFDQDGHWCVFLLCSERRQALEASLPEDQRLLVDMARVGLIFNCYNTLQVSWWG
jgi:hypothetical protein